jgi:beta-galactosidase
MYIGADYYPEHVLPEQWERDASLMKRAGFNVTRLAEFAWIFMEPEEGRFTFEWLDEAIKSLGRHGIKVILGTPTAAMPAWAALRHPECLAVDKSGRRVTWGVRKNNCASSSTYRRFSTRITRAMAEHFSASPHVIGWQTDNEFGGPVCYCESCRQSFCDWLKSRYGGLDETNRAWGTHFWGHRYGAWEEIPLPDDIATHNPGLCLDFRRHHSWLTARFQSEQVRILREMCPAHFVTHNFMGLYCEIDYGDLARELDFVSWDNYPVWLDPGIRYDAAAAADVMRGLKRRSFWVMEQTAGPPGWGIMGRNPRPGEIRQVAYQQLARGADSQLLFCWRSPTAGREQYWHGLLGHDGKPGRRYEEAAVTAREMHRLADELEGTSVRSDIAVIYDYESIWAFEIQPAYAPAEKGELAGALNYLNAVRKYHRALFRAGVGTDMIRPSDDLSGYKVVFAPHLAILRDNEAKRLVDFVRAGGILVSDCRTAIKDDRGLCHARTLPGLLSEALGISIEEYEALAENTLYTLTCTPPFTARHTAVSFADWVTPRGAQVLAGYEEWHMRPYAAVTRNQLGRGFGYYVGTMVGEESFYDELVSDVLGRAGVERIVRPPRGVEAMIREDGKKKILFLINHTEEGRTIEIPEGKRELLSGDRTSSTAALGPYGISVIRL